MFNQSSNINILDTSFDLAAAKNFKIAIVAGKFNSFIVDNLIKGCVESLNSYGITNNQLDIIYETLAT